MEPIQEISNNNFRFFSKRTIISFVLFVIFVFSFLSYLMSGPSSFPKGVIVNIEKGENLKGLSLDLKNKNIIRSRVLFETFIIMLGGEKHISFGDYMFEDKLNVFEIANRIVKKDRRLASVKITIPEGFNISQISDLSSSKLRNFNKERFLSKAKEGYLFPDTYFFFSSDTDVDVLKYMTENFDRKMKNFKLDFIASGKSENEIITFASIVEREAKGDNDRGIIAGILWNRIKKNMPLQVDAAPETYKKKGLPEHPICNPGLESIGVTFHPTTSDYLYYLHDKDGQVHFAKTFTEHKKNKKLYLN